MKISWLKIIAIIVVFFIVEMSDVIGFKRFHPELVLQESSHAKILSWTRMPWPAFYEIEVASSPPETLISGVPSQHRIETYRTVSNTLSVHQEFPVPTYWRVIAMSLRQSPLGMYSNWIAIEPAQTNVVEAAARIKPIPTVAFSPQSPAWRHELFAWSVVEGAIYYELEFLGQPPENPNGTELSKYGIWSTREVFKNGYMGDLSQFQVTTLYWRVRALDYYGNPLGVFSDAQKIHVDNLIDKPLQPYLTVDFNANGSSTPLYPVYAWIPIPGAVSYEVEITSQPPENPRGVDASQYRIWRGEGKGYDLYDDTARNVAGTYYWRVRGLDGEGQPVGVYSETGTFTVDFERGHYAACFGDSITHGGGAVSYSPSDLEYDYETYLNFPTVNLGRSGDTTDRMVERFDSDVLPFSPKYLIILGGTNSLRGGTTGFQVIEELIELRTKCQQHGIRPIFLTLPPINPDAIERVFAEETVPHWREEMDIVNHFIRQQKYYIDVEPFLSNAYGGLPERYAVDGLHPDIEAKKIMARVINENWHRVTK